MKNYQTLLYLQKYVVDMLKNAQYHLLILGILAYLGLISSSLSGCVQSLLATFHRNRMLLTFHP